MPRGNRPSAVRYQLTLRFDLPMWEYLVEEARTHNESLASVVRRMLIRSQYSDTVFLLAGRMSGVEERMALLDQRLSAHEENLSAWRKAASMAPPFPAAASSKGRKPS